MAKLPKVSIIIVNFNQKELTLNCLISLKKMTYSSYEIILVDNHSSDGSVQEIKKKFSRIKLIQNGDNLGFTGGNNIGVNKALGEYILLLNNDTIVSPNFLEPLVEDLESNNRLGIIQSKILVMDRPDYLDSVVSYQTLTGFLFHKGYLEKNSGAYDKFLYSFSAKGACMLINSDILKLGLFDDKYFAYFEETDLCWRAWLMGYKVGFEPRSVIYHKMGATSSTMNRSFMHYHSFKNRLRTIIKNASLLTLLWMLPTHLIGCMGLIGYFILVGETEGAVCILRALWWNLINLPDSLKLRAKVQRLRKISDGEIFNQVMLNPSLSFYFKHLSLVKNFISNDR